MPNSTWEEVCLFPQAEQAAQVEDGHEAAEQRWEGEMLNWFGVGL